LARIVLPSLFLLPAGTRLASAAPASALEGVWQVMKISGQRLAGVYIFAGSHYSMMAATTDRPEIDDARATANELRAVCGPMLGNAGTYEISGNQITIHPIVAKFPRVMKAGAYEIYSFQIEDKTLTLTQVRNTRGPVERGTVAKLVRVE